MSVLESGGLRIVGPSLSNVVMDQRGIHFSDGSGYDVASNTVTAAAGSNFSLYRKGGLFWLTWVLVAEITNGNGRVYNANFRQV